MEEKKEEEENCHMLITARRTDEGRDKKAKFAHRLYQPFGDLG